MLRRSLALPLFACALLAAPAGPQAGLLVSGGRPVFPIGSYELPSDQAGLRAMAQAGINLVRCHNRRDLDRAAAAGMLGWVPVPLEIGTEGGKLRAIIEPLAGHPALAVWEGPDEIVWNFTAYSGLFQNGTYPTRDEWWRQTPLAIQYSEKRAAELMPKLRSGIALVRELDKKGRPVWINEAARSDLKFIRQYSDAIDITGCDVYPVHASARDIVSVARYTERFKRAGGGLPVWMVLQGFAWGELQGRGEAVTYPTFAETRQMAWSAIANGAKGVLYWGMDAAPPHPAFRESLYAVTSELAALQSFLVSQDTPAVRVDLIDSEAFDKPAWGVASYCRTAGPDWLIALVNEDDRPHMGVVVSGLNRVKRLELLYGSENVAVRHGEFVTRLLPFEVKLFATGRHWESARKSGREFVKP